MFSMYEAIINIRILLQFLYPKMHRGTNTIMFYYFPSPGMSAIEVLCKQQNIILKTIAEQKKPSLSTHKHCAGTL